jgi:hypothetical protein
MDDVTNQRFQRLESRIDAVEANLNGRIDRVASDMAAVFNASLDVASKGLVAAIEQHVGGLKGHIDGRFQETMRAFQAAADQRARIQDLEERLAKIEALLAAGGTRQ